MFFHFKTHTLSLSLSLYGSYNVLSSMMIEHTEYRTGAIFRIRISCHCNVKKKTDNNMLCIHILHACAHVSTSKIGYVIVKLP